MATLHEQRFTEYQSYPGRQIEYTVVPRKYQHYFFEGIQSVDATANSDDVQHGQFGFKSDVINTKDYSNTTGTISLKEFNNASYVLRGMSGADPSSSFIFDPSRLEHVDVCANVYNKARNKVIRSTWLVDFVPSLSENESLDDIQTRDLSYTAIRKIDFEGYQIVHQEWLDPYDIESPNLAGRQDFKLMYPAVIDPVVDFAQLDDAYAEAQNVGMVTGKGRHELCPIPFMLRVIVNGEVLDDPTKATVITRVSGSSIQSILHLTEPLAEDGIPVIAFWLADGEKPYSARAITTAPVMADIKLSETDAGEFKRATLIAGTDSQGNSCLVVDSSAGGYLTAEQIQEMINSGNQDASYGDEGWVAGGGFAWDGTFTVNWTGLLNTEAAKNVVSNSGQFPNFSLKVCKVDVKTGLPTSSVEDLGGPALIGGDSQQAVLGDGSGAVVISRNVMLFDFTSTPGFSAPTSVASSTLTGTEGLEFWLSYQNDAGKLPLRGDDSKELTPEHTIHIKADMNGVYRVY